MHRNACQLSDDLSTPSPPCAIRGTSTVLWRPSAPRTTSQALPSRSSPRIRPCALAQLHLLPLHVPVSKPRQYNPPFPSDPRWIVHARIAPVSSVTIEQHDHGSRSDTFCLQSPRAPPAPRRIGTTFHLSLMLSSLRLPQCLRVFPRASRILHHRSRTTPAHTSLREHWASRSHLMQPLLPQICGARCASSPARLGAGSTPEQWSCQPRLLRTRFLCTSAPTFPGAGSAATTILDQGAIHPVCAKMPSDASTCSPPTRTAKPLRCSHAGDILLLTSNRAIQPTGLTQTGFCARADILSSSLRAWPHP